MLNAQVVRALAADRTERAERVAANRRLVATSRPEKQPQRHRWRSRRTWTRAPEHAPIQA